MTSRLTLSGSERDFIELVSRAAFSNPFSDERHDLVLHITERVGVESSHEELLQALMQRVSEVVLRMEAEGRTRVDLYPPKDRETIQSAFLFEAYHRFFPEMDELIRRESEDPDRPCTVPFAGKAVFLLRQRGFTPEEALRFFALFYQIRRAFFFIDRTLVGRSPSMKQLRMHLWSNVFTSDLKRYTLYLLDRLEDFSTFLLGETGTGKGAAAAAIGRSGYIPFDEKRGCFAESFTRSFVSINLSQFPENLIESELFGHRKGAFTGAIEHHDGIFARCSPHGAIFLDEVGDISSPVQIKLLQVLQDRVYTPVGSHERHRFRGRVVAATNRPLDELRRQGRFRDDLYYRLCSDLVVVPPLRRRLEEDPGELDLLVSHALTRILGADAGGLAGAVTEAIRRALPRDYPWPGNVREVEQAVRRTLLTGCYEGDEVPLRQPCREALRAAAEGRDVEARRLLGAYCRLSYRRHGSWEEVARRSGLDYRTARKYAEDFGRR